jgi:hypothetical protein
MQHKKLVACTSAVLLAIAVACSKSSNTPVSPSGTQPGSAEAGPNGETLKASAPTPQSPINDAQPDQLSFTAGKATARYNPGAAAEYSYQFEVKNAGGTTVCSATIPGGTPPTMTPMVRGRRMRRSGRRQAATFAAMRFWIR